MGKEIILFSSEEKRDRNSVADFLHQLADKVASGEVILRQGGEELALAMPQNLVLEIKAEEETKKTKVQRSLEVEIEWTEGDKNGGAVSLG